MQNNTTTQVLLGIIAIALVALVGITIMHKTSSMPAVQDTSMTDGTMPPVTMPNQPAQNQQGATASATGATQPPASRMQQYADHAFGFTLNYPTSGSASVGTNGVLSISLAGSTSNPVTVTKAVGSADASNGKWGTHVLSYGTTGWMVQSQNEQTGNLQGSLTTPIGYTTSGLPIFSGGTVGHGWGSYDYIVALSHTKFLIIRGPDTANGSATYSATTDPTLLIAQSVSI